MSTEEGNRLFSQMDEWRREKETYMADIKKLINQQFRQSDGVVSYFSYSLNLADVGEHIMIGSYHVLNVGSSAITNPYICLKFSEDHPFQFSGKYVTPNTSNQLRTAGSWERIHQSDEEIWLKPLGEATIKPTEQLSFSNFQLKWKQDLPIQASLRGYTYSDQQKEGTPAVNQFNVSKVN
ncbi:hypothetical protein [Alkalibacillus aidingensis]|uniref:hypothetical protein n=1 Tax=Alkalibacillus aidingensis TaxID=2747607 RepID=UPI00166035EC|nr:hypothetical protein [Alkalibacillus aidingensis]